MEVMLVCENPACRFLIDLREVVTTVNRSSLVLSGCPECGRSWSDRCPFCSQALDVSWKEHHPHCAACHQALRPEPPEQSHPV